MKNPVFFVLILFLLQGCKKDETLMSGDISGQVILINQYWDAILPQSGTKIVLYGDSKPFDSTLTDNYGGFVFNNLPYGRYDIYSSRAGFIRSWSHGSLFHVGGHSATEYVDYLYEIPQYQIEIDTIRYVPDDLTLYFQVKVDGDTILPGNGYSYYFRAFLSTSPDVSSENYLAIGKGGITDYGFENYQKVAAYGRVSLYNIDKFDEIKSQPLFMVIYPIANNQGYGYTEFLKGSLGKPSNVISFDWNEISGE